MTRVSVSILDADFLRLGEELAAVEAAGADAIHLDIMDGHFVGNISYGVTVAQAVRRGTRLPVHAHLMVDDPERFVPWFAPSADLIIAHVETCREPAACLAAIRAAGRAAGVSLNPDTPVESLRALLPGASDVLVMSVYPGRGGQSFIPATLDRIRELRALIRQTGSRSTISVDGGVNPANCCPVIEAGADVLIAGSSVFRSPDYGATIRSLKSEA